jgi:hypothetical protein
MKGLPRRPRRVAQTHTVAEKQNYLAVPYGDERERGQIVLPHFHFKTDTKSLRTVIKSKPENRNVKVQDLTPTSSPRKTDAPDGAMGEGIAIDSAGNLFTAEATVRGVTKYVKD